MSLLLIDVAYLGLKSATTLGWYLAKQSYNLVAYTVGSEPIVDEKETSETQELLKEIRGLREEVGRLKSQMEYINDQTYQLVDPNHLSDTEVDEPSTVMNESSTEKSQSSASQPIDTLDKLHT